MTKTSCLCGDIEFQVTGSFGDVRYCHCSQCRKVTGSAFSANAKIDSSCWRLSKGEALVTEYEQSPGIFRAFCGKCGSPLYARIDSEPDFIRVRLGSYDNPAGVKVVGNVWVSSKAPWYRIPESEQCFAEESTDKQY